MIARLSVGCACVLALCSCSKPYTDERVSESISLPTTFSKKVDSSLESTFDHAALLQSLAPLWQDFQATHAEFSHIALADLPLHSHAIHAFIATCHNGFFHDKTILLTLEPCNHFGKTPPCAQPSRKSPPNACVSPHAMSGVRVLMAATHCGKQA